MKLSKERRGEAMMVLFSMIEGWFPIVSSIVTHRIGSVFAYAWTTLFAALFFFSMLFFRKRIPQLWERSALKDLLRASFLITAMYLLIFLSMRYTTAGNVAVIVFLQLLFSWLYFNLFGDEPMDATHTLGAFLMGAGAVIVLMPENFRVNFGDLLVLVAAAIAPIANLYQKRAGERVASETILTFRSLFALPILFFVAFLSEPLPLIEDFRAVGWLILINGFIIMGFSKILWVETLQHISITKMSAMMALMPLFTLLFAYFTLHEIPTPRQIFGIVPILVGGILITRAVR